MTQLSAVALFLLVICSCASGLREQQTKIISEFKEGNFTSGLKELEESDLKEEEKLRLLYLMEKGSLLFHKKDFYHSAKTFSKANELVDKLYTKSIREQIASSLVNENSKTFYGSVFERSLLYYYQALSFFELSKQDHYVDNEGNKKQISSQDQKNYLMSSRSTLLAWDSFFSDLRRSYNYKSIQQMDLTSKSLAAKIHEQMGTRRDAEIALQLYKDALDILNRFAPAYSVFNEDYLEYNKVLSQVLAKKKKGNELKTKKPTKQYEEHQKFLQLKILGLSKRLRPREYRRLKKKLKLNPIEIKHNAISIVVELDYINRLESKNFAFNLNTALSNIEDPNTKALVEGIGVPVLTYFALGPLGLGYVSHSENVSIYSTHNAGMALTKEIGLEFQLPYLPPPKRFEDISLEVHNKEGKLVTSKPIILMNSFDDLAYINSQEMIEGSFSKRALRVGLKYVAAIAAAYMTYKSMKNNNEDSLARAAALTQFMFSAKAISASEQADSRHWSLLPAFLGQVQLDLPEGEYVVSIVEPAAVEADNPQNSRIKSLLGDLTVSKSSKTLFTYRKL